MCSGCLSVSANVKAATDIDSIVQLESNIDDLSPQAYESVMDRLFAAGAVDVTLTPVIMKRGRPGVVISTLVPPEKTDTALSVLFRETTALGVRIQHIQRYTLPRRITTVQIRGGEVRMKVADVDRGQSKAAPEYLDCKRVAEQTGRPVKDIMEDAILALSAGTRHSQKCKIKSKR